MIQAKRRGLEGFIQMISQHILLSCSFQDDVQVVSPFIFAQGPTSTKNSGNSFQWDDLWGSICRFELTGYNLALQILGICWGHKSKPSCLLHPAQLLQHPKMAWFSGRVWQVLSSYVGQRHKNQAVDTADSTCMLGPTELSFSICFPTL